MATGSLPHVAVIAPRITPGAERAGYFSEFALIKYRVLVEVEHRAGEPGQYRGPIADLSLRANARFRGCAYIELFCEHSFS